MNIIGGEPATVGRYPYFAHPRGFFLCGATLIHARFVSNTAINIESDGLDAIEKYRHLQLLEMIPGTR